MLLHIIGRRAPSTQPARQLTGAGDDDHSSTVLASTADSTPFQRRVFAD
ncbi:hypothetical protein MELE44368_18155 [Mycolicibacterium elephantis DSM 44368]|uniref:Uncharacterized protein n=1 Tax=Mycolicibacterium elephantis DSM 44368 TaxID=1335622 RepID=A0A439DUT0_9MYCO|nr:hypothetical protein MELE44368_18155 [Mycolicibacterium elephantis DSM 44368]